MKAFKRLLIVLALIILIYLIGGVYISRERTVNRSIIINAAESQIKKNLDRLPAYTKFGDMSTSTASSWCYYLITPRETDCEVTLSMDINSVDDTYHKWMGWLAAQMVEKEFAKGLKQLKKDSEEDAKLHADILNNY